MAAPASGFNAPRSRGRFRAAKPLIFLNESPFDVCHALCSPWHIELSKMIKNIFCDQ